MPVCEILAAKSQSTTHLLSETMQVIDLFKYLILHTNVNK